MYICKLNREISTINKKYKMRKLFFMLLVAAITTLSGSALTVNNTAGNLAQSVSNAGTVTTLVVTGTMDASDFVFITNSMPSLTSINLSGVSIVPYNKGNALYGTVTNYNANEIPRTAFFGKKLTSVTLPSNLQSIGYAAFAGCYQLRSITIPASVAIIDDYAFSGSGLTSIVVPQSVQIMGKGVFSRCESLTSATINSWFIGDFAFLGDIRLANVSVGASVDMIGRGAFNGCTLLSTINFDPACRMTRIDEEAFINSGLQNIDVKSLGVGTVGDWAFAQTKLRNLALADEMTVLGDGALAHNPLLTSVTLPGLAQTHHNGHFNAPGVQRSLERINDYTFAGDALLQAGNMLKNDVETIGDYAFYNVSAAIDTMRLPASINYLGERAMAGMTGMRALKVDATEVPELGADVWAGVNQHSVPLITASEEVAELYKAADQWMNFFFDAGFILGDVNGDGVVAINDVTTFIDYLLGGGFEIDVRAADFNGDGKATIADVTGLIDILLNGNTRTSIQIIRTKLSNRLASTADALVMSAITLRSGDTRTIEVALNNRDYDYTALQCELVLPEGVELVAVEGIERGLHHKFYANRQNGDENVYCLIGLSDKLNKFAGHEGNILRLTVSANEDFDAADAEIILKDVLLVNMAHRLCLTSDVVSKVNDASGVEQITGDKEIANIRYINVAGQESDAPFDGLNIVITTYVDGTSTTVKVLK